MASKQQKDELAALEIEERKLRLEHLRMTVETEKARRANILLMHQRQQETLDDTNRQIIAQQKACKHRKGGKNLEGILNGHDSNYSVIKHTYAWGEMTVMCTRCSKEWRRPAESLRKSDPELFTKLMDAYIEAVNFPTDNEPSGTQLFIITRNQPEQRATA